MSEFIEVYKENNNHARSDFTHLSFLCFRNKEDVTDEKLSQARVFVVAGPREKFTGAEVTIEITKR